MATIKEADPGSPTQLTEVPKTEQNGFSRFIEENNEAFDRHSFLTYELRDEEAGWKNSPTVNSLVEKGIEVAYSFNPNAKNLNSKTMRRVRAQMGRYITKYIFSNSSEKDRLVAIFLPQSLSAQRRVTPQSEALIQTLGNSLDDFRTSYHEATAPLVSGIRESKAELMGKFEHFLLSNPSNIFAFADFLSDKKNNSAKIEDIRPFLSSFGDSEQSLMLEKKEGTLRHVARKWTDELKENPNPATIDDFTALIKSKSSNIREWLEFAAQGVDIANYLKSRPDVSTWTTELREALFAFVSSRYSTACSSIENELGEFRRPLISKPISPIDLGLEKRKRATATVVKKEPDDEEGTLETAEKGKYPVGILTKEVGSPTVVRVLGEEELTRRLQKEAHSLDPADQRMMADLEKIFLSLREDPYGLGTEKLKGRSVIVGNRTLPLRRIYPHKRIGLSHDHPYFHDLRIVYVIYKNNGVPSIGLEGVYKHEDYMKKFGS